MPEFPPTWLDPADVAAWLRLNAPQATTDTDELNRVSRDAEIYVERCRAEWWVEGPTFPTDPDDIVYEPDAETYQGAVMYAARAIRRRNSPSGLETAVDGNPVFVSRYDSDIEKRLRVGIYQTPGVG